MRERRGWAGGLRPEPTFVRVELGPLLEVAIQTEHSDKELSLEIVGEAFQEGGVAHTQACWVLRGRGQCKWHWWVRASRRNMAKG